MMETSDRGAIVGALDRWSGSVAMRRLAEASGWPWPDAPVRDRLAELARLSTAWDFRRRLEDDGRDPQALTAINAEVDGRLVDEETIAAAAADLGLAGRRPPTGSFTHVVVLGGTVRACLRRTREAARLREVLAIPRVVALTAHRVLEATEPADAVGAGWGALELESEAASAAVRDVFTLSPTADSEAESWWDGEVTPAETREVDPDELRRRRSWVHRRWQAEGLDVEVVAAPSGDQLGRPADTADRLAFWSGRAGIDRSHRLLLVTTDHHVPAEHFEAVRTLGIGVGCAVATCGVAWIPPGDYLGAAYLQEIRSALLAAVRLVEAVEAVGTPAAAATGR